MITIKFTGRLQVKDKLENFDQLSKEILKMLKTLSYGSITIVVQDGKVIQLEKNEKVRLR